MALLAEDRGECRDGGGADIGREAACGGGSANDWKGGGARRWARWAMSGGGVGSCNGQFVGWSCTGGQFEEKK